MTATELLLLLSLTFPVHQAKRLTTFRCRRIKEKAKPGGGSIDRLRPGALKEMFRRVNALPEESEPEQAGLFNCLEFRVPS